MKHVAKWSKVLLAPSLAALLSLGAMGSLAGYYINSSGQHIYVDDSYIHNGTYYYGGSYYTAYTGSLNTSYSSSYYTQNWLSGLPYYSYNPNNTDSLGGVVAPRATMIEARANNHPLGISVIGMRQDLMDLPAIGFGVTATRLTFDQSLGRAADKSLTMLLRSATSSVSDADQYALGIYATYDGFHKALDEGLDSLTLIDRNETFRVTVSLKSFVEALGAEIEDQGLSKKKDPVLIQMRPVTMPNDLEGYTANAAAYEIKVILYTEDDDSGSSIDLSDMDVEYHVMLKANEASRSFLATVEEGIAMAETPKWSVRNSGACYASGYVGAGSAFTVLRSK